jgi:hypothetical protein
LHSDEALEFSPRTSAEFESLVGTTLESLYTVDLSTFNDCLHHLCSIFAYPHPDRETYLTAVFMSPLLGHLISIFDDPIYCPIVLPLTRLFIDISALNPLFADVFLDAPFFGHEKITHVHATVADNVRCLLHVLAFNTFSRITSELLEHTSFFLRYCAILTTALAQDNAEIAFFAPFVTIAFLRSRPLPGPENNSRFLAVMADYLLQMDGRSLQTGMWALYCWFRKSWRSGAGARYVTKRFAEAVTAVLETEDTTVIKLALYVHCQLWITSGQEYGERKVAHYLVKKYQAMAGLLVDMIVGPVAEIASLALLLLNNCIAADRLCFESLPALELLEPIYQVLDDGSVLAKEGAVELLCTIVLCRHFEDWSRIVDEQFVLRLVDALAMESPGATSSVLLLLQCLIRQVPELPELLGAQDFDQLILDMDPELDPGHAGDAILAAICEAKEAQLDWAPLPTQGAWGRD